jgi:hypothetical protein
LTAYLLIFWIWGLGLFPLWYVALFSAKSYHLLSWCGFFAGIFSGKTGFIVYLRCLLFLNIIFGAFLLPFLSFLLPLDDTDFGADFFIKKIMQRLFERFFWHLHHYAFCTFFAKFSEPFL